ncbi:MAG: hypothetical protein DLM54_03715 [Acidimicrobiales bacterium]|nr:MAG: hypothetical protein DLM54_03715 [Acidimicrobiales bacterium]
MRAASHQHHRVRHQQGHHHKHGVHKHVRPAHGRHVQGRQGSGSHVQGGQAQRHHGPDGQAQVGHTTRHQDAGASPVTSLAQLPHLLVASVAVPSPPRPDLGVADVAAPALPLDLVVLPVVGPLGDQGRPRTRARWRAAGLVAGVAVLATPVILVVRLGAPPSRSSHTVSASGGLRTGTGVWDGARSAADNVGQGLGGIEAPGPMDLTVPPSTAPAVTPSSAAVVPAVTIPTSKVSPTGMNASTAATAPPTSEPSPRLSAPVGGPRPRTPALVAHRAPSSASARRMSSAHQQSGAVSWYAITPGTCASRTIAKGTVVTVTDLANGRSTTCVVDDRGPYISGRILDLAESTFAALTNPSAGVLEAHIRW